MGDDFKKQMLRFENLISFEGKLDVTSRKSMEKLINALSIKYKKDVQSNLFLHRLEFFYDLVERQNIKRQQRVQVSISQQMAEQKSSRKTAKDEGKPLKDEVCSDELTKIDAKDIDDWKDLMTLSRIYYVMEHPRSAGLVWKRRISKKKKIDKFEDRDLIEWKVSRNFYLRGLEEWARRRSNSQRLAKLLSYDVDDSDDDSDESSKEMDDLYQLFGSFGKRQRKRSPLQKKIPRDRPFKLYDESIEDWIESYSEDSEYSDTEDVMVEIEDFFGDTDIKISEFEERVSPALFNEEDISELFAVHPEFYKYKEDIFKQMDQAKAFEEWFILYKEAISQIEESKAKDHGEKFEEKLDAIVEEEEKEKLDAIEKEK